MSELDHAHFMGLALQLVDQAEHRTSPNPIVGCVVVRESEVVGRGVTQPCGHSHAEVMALKDAGAAAQGATMYVTLEPCCHHGRTGPCTDAIIAAGVRKVYVGVIDPNPLVQGRGLDLLKAAGIEAEAGVLGSECEWHHAPFTKFITHKRPWVTLKAAMTLDGQIATPEGDSKWITGVDARRDVHRLRAKYDGVLVGANTVKLDNPKLTVRDCPGDDPIRIVLSTTADLMPTLSVLGSGTLVYVAEGAPLKNVQAIKGTGAEVIQIALDVDQRISLCEVLDDLARRGIVRLLVEGGGEIHRSFIEQRLADELCLYMAPKLLGMGRPAFPLKAPSKIDQALVLARPSVELVGQDLLIRSPILYPADVDSDD